MALLGKSSDHKLLAVEIILKARHEATSRYVRIRTLTAYILTYTIDNKYIDIVKLHTRKSALCDLKHLMVPLEDVIMSEYLHIRDIIISILYYSNTHNYIKLGEEFLGNKRNSLSKGIKALLMEP